ncbi:hypothetical protein PUMCH_001762 [Australozyma saopauloensis]|uniref:RING-type domain-containing protein n=1 Tax=Australozyma saopauloensis TaxID=291208 RepID=A0AAX4H7F2_9ASCO|nr:hypothetical protein PUMCH_001762 [[Candida] saopauloensis]
MFDGKVWYSSPRVLQLDAGILDGELFSLLKQQLSDAFQLLSPKAFSYNLHPELYSLLLKLLLFRVTTLKTGSSYGFTLQNLKLSDHKTGKVIGQRLRYVLLAAIFGQYAFEKAKSYLYNMEESLIRHRKIWLQRLKQALYRFRPQLLRVSDDFIKIAGLINFVLFLVQGKYSSLLHRVLGIVITPLNADLLKFNGDNVSFEFQNRQLVWNVMTEFLVFVIPLLQVQKWRRLVHSMLSRRGQGAVSTNEKTQTKYSTLPISQCAICIEMSEANGIKAASTQITNPYVTNCGHIFCYICLATRKNAMENGSDQAELCPRCNLRITSFQEYGSDDSESDRLASIVVEYQENGQVNQIDEEQSDTADENVDDQVELDDNIEDEYSDNEDLEEEIEEVSEFEDDYGTDIDVE